MDGILFFTVIFTAIIVSSKLHNRFDAMERKIDALAAQKAYSAQNLSATEAEKTGPAVAQEAPHAVSAADMAQQRTSEDTPTVAPTINSAQDVTEHSATQEDVAAETPIIPSQPGVVEKFFTWLHIDWPMKVGGLLVILAVGWFVTYAADQGWLSETARVVLGYLFGIACLGYGVRRAQTVTLQGNVFLIIGIAAMFIATLAGVNFPTVQLSETAALIVMLLTVGLVTLISLKQNKISLTGAMIFFASIVPLFFFNNLSIDIIFLYLFVLTIGTLWVVARTGWRSLVVLMIAVVGLYSIGYIADEGLAAVESTRNIILAFIFSTVFYSATVSAIIRSRQAEHADLFSVIGTGALFLLWVLSFATEQLEVPLLLVGVLLFSIASYGVHRATGLKTPTILFGIVSSALLVVATSLQFDGAVLTIAYICEVTAALVLSLYILRDTISQNGRVLSVLLYALPMLLVLEHIQNVFNFISAKVRFQNIAAFEGSNPAITEPLFSSIAPDLFVIFIALFSAFMITIAIIKMRVAQEGSLYMRIFAYTGATITLLFVWLLTHVTLPVYDVATFVSLLLYTVTGVAFYVLSMREGNVVYRTIGMILFGIVLARVFIVEFWQMEMGIRIITAFALGALLISTAFIARKKD